MVLTLVLSCVGLAGLIEAAATSVQQITTDSEAVALSVAFAVVAAPAYIVLAMITWRRLRDDPAEAQSAGWALYLTLVLFGSLVATVSLLVTVLGDLLVVQATRQQAKHLQLACCERFGCRLGWL